MNRVFPTNRILEGPNGRMDLTPQARLEGPRNQSRINWKENVIGQRGNYYRPTCKAQAWLGRPKASTIREDM